MAHNDWKRYYVVVYDAPPILPPVIWQQRSDAVDDFNEERRLCEANPHKRWPRPIGIVRVRGTKRNPALQTWLLHNSR